MHKPQTDRQTDRSTNGTHNRATDVQAQVSTATPGGGDLPTERHIAEVKEAAKQNPMSLAGGLSPELGMKVMMAAEAIDLNKRMGRPYADGCGVVTSVKTGGEDITVKWEESHEHDDVRWGSHELELCL